MQATGDLVARVQITLDVRIEDAKNILPAS